MTAFFFPLFRRRFSPFGVCFLVVTNILEMKSFSVLLGQMGLYFCTVLVGLVVHGFITVPSLYLLCLRKFPVKFIKNMSPAIVTAFGTGSRYGKPFRR